LFILQSVGLKNAKKNKSCNFSKKKADLRIFSSFEWTFEWIVYKLLVFLQHFEIERIERKKSHFFIQLEKLAHL
jgi:hypothetical protein